MRLRPVAEGGSAVPVSCSTLGSRAFLSAAWASALRMRVGPSVSLLVPKGQAGSQVSQTRGPLGVMPWPFTVVISEYRYFSLQTHKSDRGQLVWKTSVRRVKETQVAHDSSFPCKSFGCHRILVFPNVFLFCFLVKTRPLVSLQERHPL